MSMMDEFFPSILKDIVAEEVILSIIIISAPKEVDVLLVIYDFMASSRRKALASSFKFDPFSFFHLCKVFIVEKILLFFL
jgi:hypothetical protein